MAHTLEKRYGLTAVELLDAIEQRFRLRAALEGAVAEIQMEAKIKELVGTQVQMNTRHTTLTDNLTSRCGCQGERSLCEQSVRTCEKSAKPEEWRIERMGS